MMLLAILAVVGTLTPCDLDFKLVHERRFQLDGTIPFEGRTFVPGAQYTAKVTALPAAVRFVTDGGEEKFRYDLAADDAKWPKPPFELSLLVSGRTEIGVYTGKGPAAKLVELAPLAEGFDPRRTEYARTLRFAAEGGATDPRSMLSAGIGQADVRFVTEGRENRPYVEDGRLFFTFSARSYGAWLGVMSVDPRNPSDLRLEGAIFFDYGDGLLRNDVAADLFHDSVEGNWKAYVCNFSTASDAGVLGRAPGGVNVAWCADCPLRGVHVMKARPLGLPGMNEDPDGIWDAAAGKWRLLLSEFTPVGIRASMWESSAWDGPFVRLTDPVKPDSTGTAVFPFDGGRTCVFGSIDRACYVFSYPGLEKIGTLGFDRPPWPTDPKVRGMHGRVWPAIAEYEKDGRRHCLLLSMDRENFPGMPSPNWTYGKLMLYDAEVQPRMDENLSVLISDIHVQTNPDKAYSFTARELPKRVKEILAMRPLPRRVICFGDMTFNAGEPEAYAFLREQLKPLKAAGIDVILGMGNHDRRVNFLEVFPEAGKDQPVEGRLVYKTSLGHCDLILLDSLNGEEKAVGGELGAEQEAWLAREVAAAKRPVILGAHHPQSELFVGGKKMLAFMREHDKVVGWINGHEHYWQKQNLFWGAGPNEDVIRSLMLPTGGAWGEIGIVTLRTYPDRAVAKLKMIDMVWHDALKPGERRPEAFDAIVADQDDDAITFPYDRPMLRPTAR